MTAIYEFEVGYYQNAFGANTDSYAQLYRNGELIEAKNYFFHHRAAKQCVKWQKLYGATPR